MGRTSRISREAYVRSCERLRVKFPGPTRRRMSDCPPYPDQDWLPHEQAEGYSLQIASLQGLLRTKNDGLPLVYPTVASRSTAHRE